MQQFLMEAKTNVEQDELLHFYIGQQSLRIVELSHNHADAEVQKYNCRFSFIRQIYKKLYALDHFSEICL